MPVMDSESLTPTNSSQDGLAGTLDNGLSLLWALMGFVIFVSVLAIPALILVMG